MDRQENYWSAVPVGGTDNFGKNVRRKCSYLAEILYGSITVIQYPYIHKSASLQDILYSLESSEGNVPNMFYLFFLNELICSIKPDEMVRCIEKIRRKARLNVLCSS